MNCGNNSGTNNSTNNSNEIIAQTPSSSARVVGCRLMSAADVSGVLSRYLTGDDAQPRDATLFQRALVHRTCAARSPREPREPRGCAASYERLEFLGDAVLSLVTATYLYERYPREDEGFLSRMRTKLINGRMLASLCARTDLPAFISAGSEGLATASATLEDVFEAFLGAIYLDRGMDAARRWLVGFLEDHVDFAELAANQDTAKAMLNRHYMRHHGFVPQVEEIDVGVVRLRHPETGAVISTGSGACRRDAEDQAVRRALKPFLSPADRGGAFSSPEDGLSLRKVSLSSRDGKSPGKK